MVFGSYAACSTVTLAAVSTCVAFVVKLPTMLKPNRVLLYVRGVLSDIVAPFG